MELWHMLDARRAAARGPAARGGVAVIMCMCMWVGGVGVGAWAWMRAQGWTRSCVIVEVMDAAVWVQCGSDAAEGNSCGKARRPWSWTQPTRAAAVSRLR